MRAGQVPAPARPRGDQVLVRVAASSVNGTDLGLARRGGAGLVVGALHRGPLVLGFDVAGEVAACGPAVTAFAPGEQVVALLDHSGGGMAEQVLVPQARAARAPAAVPPEEAGALPLAGLTALQALHGHAALHARRSPRVLVVGAAGGIGSFGVQLARIAGAHVTALADAARAPYLRDLGADEVVDRHTVDVLAAGERWDVVLDAPSVLDLRSARRVLTDDGVLVSTHPISPDALRALAAGPRRTGGPRFAAVRTQARSGDLARLVRLVDDGALRIPVHAVHDLQDAAAALALAGGGAVRGKVAVTV